MIVAELKSLLCLPNFQREKIKPAKQDSQNQRCLPNNRTRLMWALIEQKTKLMWALIEQKTEMGAGCSVRAMSVQRGSAGVRRETLGLSWRKTAVYKPDTRRVSQAWGVGRLRDLC